MTALRLDLAGTSRVSPGQLLEGQVHTPLQPSDGAQLLVRLWWAAEGTDARTDEKAVVAEQALPAAGGTFSLRLPTEAPLSHPGREVRVFWNLTARLKVPGQEDHVSQVALEVVSGAGAPAPTATATVDALRRWQQQQAREDLLVMLAFGALAGIGAAVGAAVAGLGMLSPLALAGGGLAGALGWRSRLPRTAPVVGPVSLGGTTQLPAGHGAGRWVLEYREEGMVTEKRHYQSGGSYQQRRWRRHSVALAEGTLQAGEATLHVPLPATGPATFLTPRHRIRWGVWLVRGAWPRQRVWVPLAVVAGTAATP